VLVSDVLRIAVIGAGSIAQRYHLPSLSRLQRDGLGLELAAVCDLDAARAERAAAQYGFARTFTDYETMLTTVRPDAVWVLVPYAAMRQVAGDVLAAGVPTFMEKPPGRSLQEARELAAIAARAGTPTQVAFNRRYAPLVGRAMRLASEAGGVTALSCQFFRCGRQETDFCYATGIHGLDALRYLGPSEVQRVSTLPVGSNGALVTFTFDSGVVAHMQILPQVGVQAERYTIHAGPRSIEIDGLYGPLTTFPGYLRCYDGGRLSFAQENSETPAPAEVICGFQGESQAFVSALQRGGTPTPSLAEALRSVQTAQAVRDGVSLDLTD